MRNAVDEAVYKALQNEYYSFWDFKDYVSKNMCIQPGCTTCYCLPYRTLLKRMGVERLNELIENADPDGMYMQLNLDWHDMLEIMFVDHPREQFRDCYLLREYDMVWTEYRRFRKEKYSPRAARIELLDILDERALVMTDDQEENK